MFLGQCCIVNIFLAQLVVFSVHVSRSPRMGVGSQGVHPRVRLCYFLALSLIYQTLVIEERYNFPL